jgi:tetratricopeptide (TPR) repeat protein
MGVLLLVAGCSKSKSRLVYHEGVRAEKAFRFEEAAADFKKAIRIAPRSGIAGLSYYHLGIIEDRFMNRPDHAVEDYIRALENLSDIETRQKASFYLARDLVTRGRLNNALSVLKKLTESRPPESLGLRATDLTARILEREEHYRQALALYRKVMEGQRSEGNLMGRRAWLKVGLLEGLLGDPEKASGDLREFLRKYPHGPMAAIAEFNLARNLSEMGHDRQALALLSDVMGRYPNPDEVNAQITSIRKKMKEGANSAASKADETTSPQTTTPKR